MDLIEEMLRVIQVQSSQLNSLMSAASSTQKIVTRTLIEDYCKQAAIIYAMGGAALDYFRGAAESLPKEISWRQVKTALRAMDFDERPMAALMLELSS